MSIHEFITLGQRHLPEMEAQALRLTKNAEAAKDLLQEAAYWAFRNRTHFKEGTNFRAWSLAIIRNTFLSDYRKSKRRSDLLKEQPPQQGWSTGEITYNPAEGVLDAQTIMGIVQTLPVIYRHPFLLHFEGIKYREIANRLGIPVGTAKSRVFTARQLLRDKVDKLYRIDH